MSNDLHNALFDAAVAHLTVAQALSATPDDLDAALEHAWAQPQVLALAPNGHCADANADAYCALWDDYGTEEEDQ